MKSFKYYEEEKEVELFIEEQTYYSNKRLAIQLISETEGPWATLSINVEHIPLEVDEFIVPVRNLGKDLIKAALESGYFEDTNKRVDYGFVKDDPVWKYKRG